MANIQNGGYIMRISWRCKISWEHVKYKNDVKRKTKNEKKKKKTNKQKTKKKTTKKKNKQKKKQKKNKKQKNNKKKKKTTKNVYPVFMKELQNK